LLERSLQGLTNWELDMQNKKAHKPVITQLWESMTLKEDTTAQKAENKERPLPIVAQAWNSLENK
jgi:hypothetical protein